MIAGLQFLRATPCCARTCAQGVGKPREYIDFISTLYLLKEGGIIRYSGEKCSELISVSRAS